MSQAYMSLDWRAAPSAKVMRSRIERLLTDLDADREATLMLSSSTTVGRNLSLVQQSGRPPMVLRKANVATSRKGKAASHVVYWARLFSVAKAIIELLVSEQQVMSRFFEYKELRPGTKMTKTEVRKLWHDLALTIGVHPLALGIIPESTGQFTLPASSYIEMTTVTNVLGYLGRQRRNFTERKRLPAGSTHSIPALVEELQFDIGKTKSPPHAVVVIEHRNLKSVWTEHEHAAKDVLLVMTSGYPSAATREFLHMLSQDRSFKGVPFLFFSDHDLQGFQIFASLKYGTAATAWASEIQVCSRLVWAGPSKEDLLKSPVNYRATYEAQYRHDHPHASHVDVQREASAWQTDKSSRVERVLVKNNKKDQALINGIERLGWLKYELNLKDEVREMSKVASKFRLADLAQVNVAYLRVYLQKKVQAYSSQRTAVNLTAPIQPLVQSTPVTKQWKKLASQSSSLTAQSSTLIAGPESLLNEQDEPLVEGTQVAGQSQALPAQGSSLTVKADSEPIGAELEKLMLEEI